MKLSEIQNHWQIYKRLEYKVAAIGSTSFATPDKSEVETTLSTDSKKQCYCKVKLYSLASYPFNYFFFNQSCGISCPFVQISHPRRVRNFASSSYYHHPLTSAWIMFSVPALISTVCFSYLETEASARGKTCKEFPLN